VRVTPVRARGPRGWGAIRQFVLADPFRRSLAVSTAAHVLVLAALSVPTPTSPRSLPPPVYFVTLEEPAPAPQAPAPRPEVRKRREPSPAKLKPRKTQRRTPRPPKAKEKTPEAPREAASRPLQIRTDQPEFPYAYYLESLRRKIASRWQPPAGSGGRVVVVHFRVLRDGRVTALEVREPSGWEFLDDSALEAIRKAQPLPPLPPAFDGPWLGIELRFVRDA
jgi:TonB family protein